MTLQISDRVVETSITTGTGPMALGGAMTGYRPFSAVMADGDTAYCTIEAIDGSGMPSGPWETGLYTYNASTNSLTRTTVKDSSNAGAAVNFLGGTKRIFLNLIAAQIKSGLGGSSEKTYTQPPALANWTQQNFQATTSAADIVAGTNRSCAGVRLRNDPTALIGNTNRAVSLIRPIPGTHWRVTARLRHTGIHTNYNTYGIFARNSSTGQSSTFGFISEGNYIGGQRLNNDNSYNSVFGLSVGGRLVSPEDYWHRLSWDGTNSKYEFSKDGYSFVTGYSIAGDGFGFNGATGQVGFVLGINDSGSPNYVLPSRQLDCLSWQEEVLA